MQPKIPPHNADAEKSVLSAMLMDCEVPEAVFGILAAGDFYRQDHGEVFAAMRELYDGGTPIDAVTLSARLERRDRIHNGRELAISLGADFLTSANFMFHAEEVRRLSESRRVARLLNGLLGDPESLTVSGLKAAAESLGEGCGPGGHARAAKAGIDSFVGGIGTVTPRLRTGLKPLDAVTGGIRVPSVCIIGAYPSTGKTAFAINIASCQSACVAFFSLEMSAAMIYERLAAMELHIDYGRFNEQNLSPGEAEKARAFGESLRSRNFHVFDDATDIERQAGIVSDIRPGLVVVDYVQKVATRRRFESKRLEIDYLSGMYKQIARKNSCVVLLLSQFSRPEKGAKNPRPTMASLKESGSLEADGDYVAVLYRPHVLFKDNPEIKPEEGYLLLDKNKFGRTGKIDLYFDGKYQKFYGRDTANLSYVDDGAPPF